MSERARPPEADLYDELSAEFSHTFRDVRGGVELDYITGEQVTTRLNEALGFLAWSFVVKGHGIHAEADECWALGVLTVTVGDRTVTREQFGSQKIKRSRSSGTPLDIGFDLKGAATDSLKKCASLVGVGLYLHEREPQAPKPAPKPGGLIGWNQAVKGTRFSDDALANQYVEFHTNGAHKTPSEFFEAATREQASALLRAISKRVAFEAERARVEATAP